MQDEEIVAVFAHEVGHFKLKHIITLMLINILYMGIIFLFIICFLQKSFAFPSF